VVGASSDHNNRMIIETRRCIARPDIGIQDEAG
jgi:hypothetical protein